jgi:asparagine synthase (glutamine-hydrolysing)
MFIGVEEEERALKEIAMNYRAGKLFNNLRGQFAIAIVDKGRGTVSLIRDQFGTIPFYYYLGKQRIIFGTSIKSILKELEELKQRISINTQVIHEYFMYRYVSGNNTFFENIWEVKPGSITKLADGEIKEEDYYVLNYSDQLAEKRLSKIRNSESFEEAFWKSLKMQTSDHDKNNIAVLSSGGIDSSILVSCFRKIINSESKTYYIGFEGYKHNRIAEVDYLSELYKTDHKNVIISNEEFAESLIESIWINEEPLGHPCSVARKCLNKQIEGETTVLLSGEGADCLYCGYYTFNLINYLYVKNPVKPVTTILAQLIPIQCMPSKYSSKIGKIRNALIYRPDIFTLNNAEFVYNKEQEISKLIGGELPINFLRNYTSLFEKYGHDNILNVILRIFQTHYLVEELNTIAKFGYSYGIEHRYPFIDVDMVNIFNQFPWKDKVGTLKTKIQVMKLAKQYLPKRILEKPKEGFGVPLESWFYDEEGVGRFMYLLSDKKTRERGILNPKYLDDILHKFHNRSLREESFEGLIWPIINFELWNRIFVDKKLVGY